jgi:hypothetical protein
MRRVIAVGLAAALLVGITAPAAHAGGGHFRHRGPGGLVAAALFAPFALIAAPFIIASSVAAATAPAVVVAPPPRVYYAPPPVAYSYAPPPVSYAPPPVSYAPPPAQVVSVQPAAPQPSVVQYPHGRYELRGDGVTVAYQWVWVPNAPVAPPPPPAYR